MGRFLQLELASALTRCARQRAQLFACITEPDKLDHAARSQPYPLATTVSTTALPVLVSSVHQIRSRQSDTKAGAIRKATS
eukprot:802765-Pleurochrysis_carterae.AAC.3